MSLIASSSAFKERRALVRVAFKNLNKLWYDKHISITTKLQFFNTNVLPILFYRSETWKFNKLKHFKSNVFASF